MVQRKTMGVVQAAACVAALVGGVAAARSEEGGGTWERFQLGAEVAYGISIGDSSDEGSDAEPAGLGFGLDAGYTLHGGVYLGAGFDYFLGDSRSATAFGTTISADVNAWTLLAEAGYDLAVGPASTLRPKLGLGVNHVGGEVCVDDSCESLSEAHFAAAVAAQFVHVLGPVYLSAEVGFMVDVEVTENSGPRFSLGVGGLF